jgi:glycosyltransferase involved in cell wall biosynthesis
MSPSKKEISISVIVPSYNSERYLRESIESILNQTFGDFELIIVNDGSTDSSPEIIKEYSKKDRRVKFLNNPKNLGLQKSLNKAISEAKGKYIARMDADDISLPTRLETQYNYLEKNKDVFLVGSSAWIIDEDGKRIGALRKFDVPNKIKSKLEKRNPIIHPSVMFRAEARFRYRDKFVCSEDYDLYLRILSKGLKITNLEEFLLEYRISKDSFVSTMPNQEFYFEKAKEFYFQRKNGTGDNYEKLNEPLIKKIPKDFGRKSSMFKIFIRLQEGNSRKTRECIQNEVRKYGLNLRIILFYLLSFLPLKFFIFIQKKLM